MYTNAQYMKDMNGNQSGIKVDINGIESFVPLDPSNTDYINIMALVQEGKLTIAAAGD
jgi:hypothetical protein